MKDTLSRHQITAGGAILARLKAVGVDYIFANSGTDFPPIIEGLAEAEAKGLDLPKAIVVPHENAAMGMAFGYFLATGRAQAVMAHTNVGLANCAIGAINAATEHIPIILVSGRTPITEYGHLGSRTVPIGWGQEMRDQTALVREAVKWDYELRYPEQAPGLVDRAYAIANSTPKGPVYLSLPREPLCQLCCSDGLDEPSRIAPAVAAVLPAALQQAARLIAEAKRPLIIAQRGVGSAEGFAALGKLAAEWGIPVCHYWALQLAISTNHPMCIGSDPEPWLSEADLVVAIDSLAPWSPAKHHLLGDAKVIQLGPDPLCVRFPVRSFEADVCLVGEPADTIVALAAALHPHAASTTSLREARRSIVQKASEARRAQVRKDAESGNREPMSKAYVARCLSEVIAGRGAAVLSELGVPLDELELTEADSWYQEPHSGGLGWSFPCALGMQLANPGRLIIATMGDGSYIFSNPTACHQIAEALQLPLLVLILNNAEWGAVRHSVLDVYPDGYASRSNAMPLISLEPSPDFEKIAEASRAYVQRVETPDRLPSALQRALEHVFRRRTQALINIRVA